MIKMHNLKFKGEQLCTDVYLKKKTFDVRFNDRDFRVGDIIQPIPVNYNGVFTWHPISRKRYEIVYIMDTTSYYGRDALQPGYVILGLRDIRPDA